MMKRRSFNTNLALGTAVLAAPAIVRAAADKPVKIGFVYIGPVGDFGWTYQHNIGRLQAAKHFGKAIETTYVANVPEAPECQSVFEDLAAKGNQLIFGTSFGYMNYMVKVAAQYPKIKFESCTGYKQAANLATYDIRFYQGRYVQGVIAGKISKTGVAGYVASVPVPEVVQGMDAFLLGMRSVNPKARLKFVMIDSWYDPGKEGDAAKALIDQGCDVITQHTDSPAPLQTAAARHIPAFGEATDMIKFAPHDQLTAIVNEWGGYYIQRIGEVLAGTWKTENTWGGFHSGMLRMAPFRNMPHSTAELAARTVASIKAGKNKVFVGPLTNQAGQVFLPAGKVMDDGTLSGLQTLVAGIQGKLA
ncbi:BMP family ABC transporter substrate-binding protein [Acidiphilium sp.]|uniref:BMP family ABC transporter substrate-binding protein n=1 Tax=Acidiphilium sp. TaxID=527 RepID=UPI003D01339B